MLTVTDNGPGLSAPEAAQLRQRWALGPAGQRLGEGAGLGTKDKRSSDAKPGTDRFYPVFLNLLYADISVSADRQFHGK